MSELENPFGFSELEDDGLDIAAIFGDGGTAEPLPIPEPEPADAPEDTGENTPETEQSPKQPAPEVEKKDAQADGEIDLFAALAAGPKETAKPARNDQKPAGQVSRKRTSMWVSKNLTRMRSESLFRRSM